MSKSFCKVYRTANISETLKLITKLSKQARMNRVAYGKMYQQPNFICDINHVKQKLSYLPFWLEFQVSGKNSAILYPKRLGHCQFFSQLMPMRNQHSMSTSLECSLFNRSYNFKGMTELAINNIYAKDSTSERNSNSKILLLQNT